MTVIVILFFVMLTLQSNSLHHATHAGLGHWNSWLVFWLVANKALCGKEQSCYRCSVLKSYTCNLSRIDDTSLAQVLVNIFAGIVAEVTLALADLVYYY